MLTAENYNAKRAIYFTKTYNYASRWYGKGATMLGLTGEITNGKSMGMEAFTNICNGLMPDGNKKLGRNSKRAAIDCTFSVPKSVSLSALIGGDERLVVAHRIAVEKTLSFIEKKCAQTRVRVGKNRPRVQTGNLIVAQFDHLESRELDPNLHTHALVMNLTQTENGKWYSLHNGRIYRNKKSLGMLYHSYLKREVEKLGYRTEAQRHGLFEITGYRREDLLKFSKRRQQIVFEVGSNASWKGREEAWDITRKAKQYLPPQELKEMWKLQAQELGIVPVVACDLRERVVKVVDSLDEIKEVREQETINQEFSTRKGLRA